DRPWPRSVQPGTAQRLPRDRLHPAGGRGDHRQGRGCWQRRAVLRRRADRLRPRHQVPRVRALLEGDHMRVLTDQPDDNDEEIKDDDIVPLDIDEIKKDRKNRGLAAVALRVDGANYSQIARILGYSNATTAARAGERVLAESAGE